MLHAAALQQVQHNFSLQLLSLFNSRFIAIPYLTQSMTRELQVFLILRVFVFKSI